MNWNRFWQKHFPFVLTRFLNWVECYNCKTRLIKIWWKQNPPLQTQALLTGCQTLFKRVCDQTLDQAVLFDLFTSVGNFCFARASFAFIIPPTLLSIKYALNTCLSSTKWWQNYSSFFLYCIKMAKGGFFLHFLWSCYRIKLLSCLYFYL